MPSTSTESGGMSSKMKLGMLREMMQARRIDAYIVPSEDDHSSEYLAACDTRRAYISHFTGSAGCAVITNDEARLWTDGRYWLQAERELDSSCWTLMKQGDTDVPTVSAWVGKLSKPSVIGIDPKLLPFSEVKTFKDILSPASSSASTTKPSDSDSVADKFFSSSTTSSLKPIPENLIDEIWSSESSTESRRPERFKSEVFVLDEKYCGEKFEEKLEKLREGFNSSDNAAGDRKDGKGVVGMVVSSLDEVAWMFNLRGADIPYNPVFFSYAILTPKSCNLYIHPASISPAVQIHLKAGGVTLKAYDTIWEDLKSWGKELKFQAESSKGSSSGEGKGKAKVVVGQRTSWAVVEALGEDFVEVKRSPVMDAKAIKNETEIEGFRQCHIRDGAALVRYFAWLEESLKAGEKITEWDGAVMLEKFRSYGALFKGLSFDTISSTGANGAIIHYSPDHKTSDVIDINKMYLCDSGGQYMDGTTDTTRTLHFGTPTDEEINSFTRVLQGHIAIDTAVFPVGTSGFQLDVFARRPLWEAGLDYRHGTSHGVGSFLNVHEGPQGIGSRIAYHDISLREGFVMSNEPGYYEDGKYGIRIENMIVVKKAQTKNNFGGRGYLGFEHVTVVPIQTSLMDVTLLTPVERKWVNDYHVEVSGKVKPLLVKTGDQRAVNWLQQACRPI